MKVGKPKSKRTPVRLRHKIQKASSAKQRKQRKEAKANPQWRSRLKKDPGIPNLFPYKAKVLAEIEESKRRKEEEQLHKRELAKARREGRTIDSKTISVAPTQDEDDLLDDDEEGGVGLQPEDDTEMDVDSNPMAALLASAQARAKSFGQDDGGGDFDASDEEEDDEADDDAWDGLGDVPSASAKKVLPKRALEDPVKGVTLLMARMQDTPDGVQHIFTHYQIPPITTATNELVSRFLVEVARKRGRLGRGGIPNTHAAALIVLSDIHENRLQLPTNAAASAKTTPSTGEVTIVKTMAAPFKLEGLWGDEPLPTAMAVDV